MIEYLLIFLAIGIAWEFSSIRSPILGGTKMYAEEDELKAKWVEGFLLKKLKARKGQASIPENDPIISGLLTTIISVTVLLMVGGLVLNTQKQAVHQMELDKCQEKFGSEFRNGSMNGEYVCIHNNTVYNPKIHALNAESTGNLLVDMIVIPLSWFGSLPLWIQIPLGILIFFIGTILHAVIVPR